MKTTVPSVGRLRQQLDLPPTERNGREDSPERQKSNIIQRVWVAALKVYRLPNIKDVHDVGKKGEPAAARLSIMNALSKAKDAGGERLFADEEICVAAGMKCHKNVLAIMRGKVAQLPSGKRSDLMLVEQEVTKPAQNTPSADDLEPIEHAVAAEFLNGNVLRMCGAAERVTQAQAAVMYCLVKVKKECAEKVATRYHLSVSEVLQLIGLIVTQIETVPVVAERFDRALSTLGK